MNSHKRRFSAWLAAKKIAAARRLSLFLSGKYDPYPPTPDGLSLSPSLSHAADYEKAPLRLSRLNRKGTSAEEWQREAREKLAELLGYERDGSIPVARHESEFEPAPGFRGRALYLRAREGLDIPVRIIWREPLKKPAPAMLCLQGTNSGMHLSWGESRMPADPQKVAAGYDIALYAAKAGYLAVCVEQACFGERRETALAPPSPDPCADAANHALLLGRCLTGEWAADLSRVLDWFCSETSGMETDAKKIHAIGHSAGGTTVIFCAALDTRITAIMASGCIGSYLENIGKRRNSNGQVIVPGILNWMEFEDVVALCAPRPFVGVTATRDHIWPFSGMEDVLNSARKVYAELGAAENLLSVKAKGKHGFYPEVSWPAFMGHLSGR